jgi:toxin-antitoxin system PIN domain toxin
VIALLDVNVLVALFDPEHVHHDIAHDWFAQDCGTGWASSPITENGALRVLASPTHELRMPVAELATVLRRFREQSRHYFWIDDVSLLDSAVVDTAAIRGHKQLTDVYLLALAVTHGGRFVTFDRGVPVGAVKGARSEHLVILAPSE